MNISRNPMIAYQQGKAAGEIGGKAEDIKQGIKFTYSFLLLALAYTNERSEQGKKDYLTKPQFASFYQEFEKNLEKMLTESIQGESGLSTYDVADLYVGHDKFVRQRYNLPGRSYDGRAKKDT